MLTAPTVIHLPAVRRPGRRQERLGEPDGGGVGWMHLRDGGTT